MSSSELHGRLDDCRPIFASPNVVLQKFEFILLLNFRTIDVSFSLYPRGRFHPCAAFEVLTTGVLTTTNGYRVVRLISVK